MESLPKERLEALIQELNTLEPLDVGRVLHELCEREAPTTPSEAAILRRAGVVPTLAVLLEPAWDNLIRLQACTLVARLCKNDPQSQEAFLPYGIIRKLIKCIEAAQGGNPDASEAIRALGYVVGGGISGNEHLAAIEDLFLSGTVHRMRAELATRKHRDHLVTAVGEFLAAIACLPTSHTRLRDAALLPLLPTWLDADRPGPFLEAAWRLSTTEAVAKGMHTEAYFEALLKIVAGASTPQGARRIALLTMCNIFGADSDHVRAEELLQMQSLPVMLSSMLSASLGPADLGAAARAFPSGSGSGGRTSDTGGPAPGAASATGRTVRMVVSGPSSSSTGEQGGAGAAAGAEAGPGGDALQQRLNHASTMPRARVQGSSFTEEPQPGAKAALRGASAAPGGQTGTMSLTAPGSSLELLGRSSAKSRAAATATGPADMAPLPLELVLHSIACAASNVILARQLATPTSPAFVVPRLLDALVTVQQHYQAGALSRALWVARAVAAAQALLRLASHRDVQPVLQAANAGAVLRSLSGGSDDPRVTEAVRCTLLHLGQVGAGSRVALAAFQALYGGGGGGAAGGEQHVERFTLTSESSEGRFQVFISHHRADAHHFALYTLYPMLVVRGVPAFVDPQHRTLSSDWAHVVASCRNMVICLSELLLASPEHVHEAEAAVAAGVHVVAVVPEGSRWADAAGHKTYDTPPPEAIESLPDRLRGIFTDRPLVYSASRHADFAQQLMSRLRLPPRTARGRPSGDWHTEEQGMEGEGARQGGQQGDTVFGIGPGDDEQDDQMGELPRRSSTGTSHDAGGLPLALPWPWSRLLDTPNPQEQPPPGPGRRASASGGARESVSGSAAYVSSSSISLSPGGGAGQVVSQASARRQTARQRSSLHRRQQLQQQQQQQQWALQQQWLHELQEQQLYHGLRQQHPGAHHRHSSSHLTNPTQHQPLGSYRSASMHRHSHTGQGGGAPGVPNTPPIAGSNAGAGGLWAPGTASPPPASVSGGAPPLVGLSPHLERASISGTSMGGDVAGLPLPGVMCQLLGLQMEMVRYELRQAVQQSHADIIHKIDRLRSDVTEQVVQLRFDLAGKIETVQDMVTALKKAVASASASASTAVSASLPPAPDAVASSATGASAAAAALPAGANSGGANGVAKAPAAGATPAGSTGSAGLPGPAVMLDAQDPQALLAQALSTKLAATLQDAVNKAVGQLQASVLASLQNPAHGPGLPAAGIAPHPPTHPNPNGTTRQGSAAVLSPIPGIELSPVVRAGAAAWSTDGTGAAAAAVGRDGGARSARVTHPIPGPVGGGQTAGSPGSARGSNPGTAGRTGGRPGPLALFDAAVAEEEAGGAGEGTVLSPSALLANVTSPATAQAALLLAQRGRQSMPPIATHAAGAGGNTTAVVNVAAAMAAAAAAGGPGGSPGSLRAGAAGAVGGAGQVAGVVSPNSGKPRSATGTLPKLTGALLSPAGVGGGGIPAGRMVERTEANPVRKAQQVALLQQQQPP